MMTVDSSRWISIAAAALFLGSGCSDALNELSQSPASRVVGDAGTAPGTDGPWTTSGNTDGTSGTDGTSSATGTDGTGTADGTTSTGTTECSDGIDNDGDGRIDGFDEECTGSFDDDEGSFATGIPGDNRDPFWQDCFFDGNSGAGDDHCRYATGCLTGDIPQTDPNCALTADCLEFCAPRAPNGCDCFGCCDVQLDDGSTVTITLTSTCSTENADDETLCPPCTKNTECGNECGECEICPGREVEDLPDSCFVEPPPDPTDPGDTTDPSGADAGTPDPNDPSGADGGTQDPISTDPTPPPVVYTCDNGTVCASNADCPQDFFCQLGCCAPELI